MKSLLLSLFVVAGLFLSRAGAVEKDVSGSITYNTTAPTGSDISNWTSGWGSGVTGWDYVGTVNGASGIYLGNNWVLTAAHVGAGTFTLAGTAYAVAPGSTHGITTSGGGTADLTLFKLTLAPNLPSLTIANSDPAAFSSSQAGSSVAMIGYGGGHGKTWGLNTVTDINLSVQVVGFDSVDFATVYGTTTAGGSSVTNDYTLIVGDSGGADFIRDSTTGQWTLAGVNEAIDQDKNSYLVQLSPYASQINSITALPEPSSYLLLGVGLLVMLWKARLQRVKVTG